MFYFYVCVGGVAGARAPGARRRMHTFIESREEIGRDTRVGLDATRAQQLIKDESDAGPPHGDGRGSDTILGVAEDRARRAGDMRNGFKGFHDMAVIGGMDDRA